MQVDLDLISGSVLETSVQSLGWEDPLGKGKATHYSILAWVPKSRTQLSNFHFHFSLSRVKKNLKTLNITKCIKIIEESAQRTIFNIL